MRGKEAVPLVWRRSLNHDWSLQSNNLQTGAAESVVKYQYAPIPANPQKYIFIYNQYSKKTYLHIKKQTSLQPHGRWDMECSLPLSVGAIEILNILSPLSQFKLQMKEI